MIFRLPVSIYNQYNSYSSNGQSSLLQVVKKSVENTYSTTRLRADGQVIVIPFDDSISFDLVPAFRNTDEISFTFPNANSGGSWKVTNPLAEIAAIRSENDAANSNLRRLCRMTRVWRDHWSVPISGMLIDTLAYQFIRNWNYKDKSYLYYDYMCRDFLLHLSNQSTTQNYWNAPGSGQWVFRKGTFEAKAKKCYNLCLEAISHETASPKREWSAKQKWREVFGSKFPA